MPIFEDYFANLGNTDILKIRNTYQPITGEGLEMPESKKRKKVVAAQKMKARRASETSRDNLPKRSPNWWAPVMVSLAIIGLLIVVIAYVTNGAWPIPGLSNGNINLFIGIGIMLIGFLMTMGWK